MASFKALCLAGVASLAAMTAANAADLLPPPPPVEYAPPPPVIGGNWYLRGDVGLGIADLNQKNSTFTGSGSVNDFQINQSLLDDSGFIDAGVGYRFNQFFRADVTGEYRGSARFSAIESYSTAGFCNGHNCPVPRGYDSYNGQFQEAVGLVNGYVDAGTWYGFTPFVGAGVGIARVGVNNVSDFGTVSDPRSGAPGGFGFAGTNYQTNFAFALMAGLDFNVTRNLTMELGYRYLDMGNVQSGVIGCVPPSTCVHETQHFHLASNDIRLGFRYAFTDFAPAFAPAAPLVTKY